jgi:hypothetical protein
MDEIISGKIQEVMESYPIQLMVDVHGTIYHMGLLEETIVFKDGKTVTINELVPGVHITAKGDISPSSPRAMMVKKVDIIE